jgi:hypothetical protein
VPKKCGDAGTTVELKGFSAIQSTPEMKAADAARLWQPEQVTSFSCRSKPPTERMFCSFTPSAAAFFSAATTSPSKNTGLALALHQTEPGCRLMRQTDRCSRSRRSPRTF